MNHTVEEIILKDNRAMGVKTKKGEFFAENIICNASPFILYEKLLKNWGPSIQEIEKLKQYDIGPTLGAAYIGLNTTIEQLNPRYKDSYIVSVNETYDIHFTKNHAIGFTLTDHRDNVNIPEGKSVLTVAIFDTYQNWEDVDEISYQQKKEEETEKLIQRLESIFPTIRDYIEICEL